MWQYVNIKHSLGKFLDICKCEELSARACRSLHYANILVVPGTRQSVHVFGTIANSSIFFIDPNIKSASAIFKFFSDALRKASQENFRIFFPK